MGKINGWRVVVFGAIGGFGLFVVQGIVHGGILRDFWTGMAAAKIAVGPDQAKALGPVSLLMALLTGVLVTWLYAAVRPRLGAGLMTAVVVALTVWGLLFAEGSLPWALYTPPLAPAAVVGALGNLVGLLLAAAIGGAGYREAGVAPDSPRRGRG